MKGVYLSLNQGWTFYQEAYSNPTEKIKHVSAYWKKELSTIPNDFCIGDIYLKSYNNKQTSNGRPKGYANGNICSKYYVIEHLPDEDVLAGDLLKSIVMLIELKSKLIEVDYIKTNNFILTQKVPQQETLEADREQLMSATHTNKGKEGYTFRQEAPPHPHTGKTINAQKQPIGSNIDYISAQSRNQKIGYSGELAVLEFERKKLQTLSNPDIKKLSEKVRHVSVEDGDGFGYDILSFDEIYIEVKTTTQNIQTPFYITANELNCSKKFKQKYYLYRLYEFGKGRDVKYYVLSGNLNDVVDLQPITYSALPSSV